MLASRAFRDSVRPRSSPWHSISALPWSLWGHRVKEDRRFFAEISARPYESLTGGEYYWMAGNFLKYGASEATFGSKTASDIPVDSNELIALCAPRLTFISYGIPESGDAKWLDQQGSFMATVRRKSSLPLLGAKGLDVTPDYHAAKMPPEGRDYLDGQLAWRQHDGGHTDRRT